MLKTFVPTVWSMTDYFRNLRQNWNKSKFQQLAYKHL